MGLKVILYDPTGELEYLLSDIFEVTGHTLYSLKGKKKEILNKILEINSNLLILPVEERDLWIEALKKKILFPFFIVGDYKIGELLLKKGFSELNLIPIPFNPLDLLNKLTIVDKYNLSDGNLKDFGFINALLKLAFLGERNYLKIKIDTKECLVNSKSASCSLQELKEILEEDYDLEIHSGDFQAKEFFESLSSLVEELLKEKIRITTVEKEKVLEEIIEEIEEGFLCVQKILNNGVIRRNFYILRLQGREKEVVLTVGLPELSGLSLLEKALNNLGKDLKDISAILLPICSIQELEVLKRLSLKVPKLNVIGRRKLEELLKLYGVGNVRFKAIEDIPFLRAGLATGHLLSFVPLIDGLSMGIRLNDKFFTGKIFGSFNTDDPEVRKIFHRILYPSRELLLLELRSLIPYFSDAKVYPLFGPKVENPEKVYLELRDYQYAPSFINLQKALNLLNFVFNNLTNEEKEKLLERIGPYVEFVNGVAKSLYTEPNLFISELFNALTYSVSSPERFFNILKELFNYGIYVPPSEV